MPVSHKEWKLPKSRIWLAALNRWWPLSKEKNSQSTGYIFMWKSYILKCKKKLLFLLELLRLVFTSDEVGVRVVIRRVQWYDLVKIKLTELEVEHPLCLWLCRLRSSENYIVGIASRNERINQSHCLTPGLVIGLFFRFLFRPRQPGFHWII